MVPVLRWPLEKTLNTLVGDAGSMPRNKRVDGRGTKREEVADVSSVGVEDEGCAESRVQCAD
jgi:hypothetical protein